MLSNCLVKRNNYGKLSLYSQILAYQSSTSKMIYHQGMSLSKHALLHDLICFVMAHKSWDSSRICHCLLFHEHGMHKLKIWYENMQAHALGLFQLVEKQNKWIMKIYRVELKAIKDWRGYVVYSQL